VSVCEYVLRFSVGVLNFLMVMFCIYDLFYVAFIIVNLWNCCQCQ